jgi:hypothetical protein
MALLPIVSFRTTIESVHLIPHDSIGGHGNCKNQEMAKITEISSNTRKSTPVAAPAHLKSILRSPRYSNYTDTRNPNTTSTKNANDNLRDSAPIQTAVPYTKRQRKAKHAASKDTKFFFLFQQKMKDFESRPFSMTKHDHNDCSPDQLLSDLNRSFAAFRTRMQMASPQHDTDRQAATSTATTIRDCTSVLLSAPSSSFSGNLNEQNRPTSDTLRTDYTQKLPPGNAPNCSTPASAVPPCFPSPDHPVTSASMVPSKPASSPSIKRHISFRTVSEANAPTLSTIKAPASVTPHGVLNPPVKARHIFSPKHASFASPMNAPTASSAKASMPQSSNTLNAHAASNFESLLLKGAQSPPVPKTVQEPETFHKDSTVPTFALSDILRPTQTDPFHTNQTAKSSQDSSGFSVSSRLPIVHDTSSNNSVSTTAATSSLSVEVYFFHNATSLCLSIPVQQTTSLLVPTLQRHYLSEFCATVCTLLLYKTKVPERKKICFNMPVSYAPPVLPLSPKPGGIFFRVLIMPPICCRRLSKLADGKCAPVCF